MKTKVVDNARRRVSCVLSCLLMLQGFSLDSMAQVTSPAKLQIVILEGEGAINNIRQRTAREPVVQVVDENRKPVAGAMVLFSSPDRGAGAVFSNGSKTLITYTDAEGKATAKGMRPNHTSGQFQIAVNASFQGLATTGKITQTNAVAGATAGATGAAGAGTAGGISKTLIAIIAVAAGAAATGAVVATRGSSESSQAPPSATINAPGAPVFTPPN